MKEAGQKYARFFHPSNIMPSEITTSANTGLSCKTWGSNISSFDF
jgi:hypothetical protein